jgi:hypothetical protein
MTRVPDTGSIISDIEFELMQGTEPRGELHVTLHAIRQEQSRLRAQVLGPQVRSGRRTQDDRELAGALFRLNDMLINLLQEALTRLEVLQRQVRQSEESNAALAQRLETTCRQIAQLESQLAGAEGKETEDRQRQDAGDGKALA